MKFGASKTRENSDETWEKKRGGRGRKRLRHINKERAVIKAPSRGRIPLHSPLNVHCLAATTLHSFSRTVPFHEEEHSKGRGWDYRAAAASISAMSENVEQQQ